MRNAALISLFLAVAATAASAQTMLPNGAQQIDPAAIPTPHLCAAVFTMLAGRAQLTRPDMVDSLRLAAVQAELSHSDDGSYQAPDAGLKAVQAARDSANSLDEALNAGTITTREVMTVYRICRQAFPGQ